MGKVFFTNSGTEATETTLKLIDKYRSITNEEREGVVVLKDSFHWLNIRGSSFYETRKCLSKFPENIHSCIWDEVERENIKELEDTIVNEHPIAIMLEPVLGKRWDLSFIK